MIVWALYLQALLKYTEQYRRRRELKLSCRFSDRFPVATFDRKREQSRIQVIGIVGVKLVLSFQLRRKYKASAFH